MKCHNCGYTWHYQGNSDYYCTCPRCYYKVRMPSAPKRRRQR